jgi:biotin transport system substrate-specific component
VPFTGQTLGVLLLATSYGATLGATTFALYLLAGIAGAPIFANGSYGIEKVVGATGGYLVGMLIASFVLGRLAQHRLDQKFITALQKKDKNKDIWKFNIDLKVNKIIILTQKRLE